MLLLSAVLVSAVSNLDNLAVGVAFGIRETRIAPINNLIIAAITMAGTAGAVTSGGALSGLIAPDAASLVGSLIIIGIGAATALGSLSSVRVLERIPFPTSVGLHRGSLRNGVISSREAVALGVALSLNNVGTGVGAGVAGVPPLATTLLAGVCSLLCVGGGSLVGGSLGRLLFGPRAPLIAGLVLLAVGAATLPGTR